jgi:hypothetical protein
MEAAGDGGRHLLIRPRLAIQGRQRLTIRGPLRLEPGEGVAVPDVVPLGLERMSRLVLLPVQRGLEPIEWATARLAPASLPDGLNLAPLPPESFDVYRVTAARPRAVMKLVEEPTHAASVRLADIRLDWQEDGACRGLAVFDLVPAGRLDCRLRMPAGARLVHLALAGLPAAATRQKNGDWIVPLGPQRLPQRLEVIWTASLPPPDRWRSSRLPVPALVDLPVHQTLWTVSLPAGFEPISPDASAKRVQSPPFELIRSKSIVELMDLSPATAAVTARDDLANWYRAWARPLAASAEALSREMATERLPVAASALASDAQLLERKRLQIESRLAGPSLLKELSSSGAIGDQPAQLWRQWCPQGQTASRYLISRGGEPPQLRRLVDMGGEPLGRAAAAIVIVIASLALAWLTRRPQAVEWLQCWPQVLGVVAGLCWWLWLSPSLLGWLLVAVSIWSAFRSGWRQTGQGASVIVGSNSAEAAARQG